MDNYCVECGSENVVRWVDPDTLNAHWLCMPHVLAADEYYEIDTVPTDSVELNEYGRAVEEFDKTVAQQFAEYFRTAPF